MERHGGALLLAVGILAASCSGPEGTRQPAAPSASAGATPAEASPASSSAVPPTGEPVVAVTCAGGVASASVPAVRALPDGVHLEAARTDGSPATVDVSTEEAGVVATAEGAANLVVEPGTYLLTCIGGGEQGVEILVTDPDGLWKSAETDCEGGGGTVGSGDAPAAAPGEAIAHLRSIVTSFRPEDVLEPAGYPEAPSGWIRLVRDGRVAASWHVVGGAGSVGIVSMQHCPDAAITYREPAPEAP